MAEKTFHVDIVTPRSQVFNGEATIATLPGVVGPFQVLVNHAPLVTQLETGDIRITDSAQKEHHFATSGGFVEINHNRLTVLAETIETAEEINITRAQSARDRAAARLAEARLSHDPMIDTARAETALARATNRLRIVGRM